jgi:hypothetical protein
MGYTITRLPGTRVFVVRGEGEGDVGEAEEIIQRLQTMASPAERAGVLFDLRGLRYIPSPAEGRYIGERSGQVGATYGFRMAYLAPPGAQYGVARTVEILSGFRGVDARVFTDEGEALSWLSQAPPGTAEAAGR